MQTKTYFASSIPAALDVARKELGSDALLVNSKPASAAAKAFGRLEVTFAYDPALPPAPRFEPERRERQSPSELDDIRRQLSSLQAALGNVGAKPPVSNDLPAASAFGETLLLDSGLDLDTARAVVDAASRRPGDREHALVQELAERIPCEPFREPASGETRILAFVGPSGRGKTTTLVKIALAHGLGKRVPVRIYSAGAHSVGYQEQMARYAVILGVPFQPCESLESLHLALSGESWKGLVLIDTPGISPENRMGISEIAGFFSRRPEIERHLVLRADARSADMSHMIARFSGMEPARLLFTGLDDALSPGALVNTAIRSGIPVTFTGTGQEIPDDLEQADAGAIARRLCGRKALAAMAA